MFEKGPDEILYGLTETTAIFIHSDPRSTLMTATPAARWSVATATRKQKTLPDQDIFMISSVGRYINIIQICKTKVICNFIHKLTHDHTLEPMIKMR